MNVRIVPLKDRLELRLQRDGDVVDIRYYRASPSADLTYPGGWVWTHAGMRIPVEKVADLRQALLDLAEGA